MCFTPNDRHSLMPDRKKKRRKKEKKKKKGQFLSVETTLMPLSRFGLFKNSGGGGGVNLIHATSRAP